MSDSILKLTKKMLGLDENYDVFDTDIVTHINGAFFSLHQLGVLSDPVPVVTDDTLEWDMVFPDFSELYAVKLYVYYKTRIGFDPPTTSFGIDAINKMIQELEWRINVEVDPRRV